MAKQAHPLSRMGDMWLNQIQAPEALAAYAVDATQRWLLFLDAMRMRGNIYLDHIRAGQPPILKFPFEIVIDGRELERPVNYALARILAPEGVETDPEKRPYVVIDPRAGQGPGIGGSKPDSQVGVALRAGHPVYFVLFFPEPVPGQTIADIRDAEAMFVETVAGAHPMASGKPCVVGNCQAGWAVAMLSAAHPDVTGPIILNGAPLSYWAGVNGRNPMRYRGGLMGGSWISSMVADLGGGVFDGANLIANFETLNPSNTRWMKPYNLFANIDQEYERFLEFERWWGGFSLLNRDELRFMVRELFIGNKLGRGGIELDNGQVIDLRNIKSPIVVFCSAGDAITPPQQALNWIADLYGDDREIKRRGQTIVYLLHEDIGHLGIFVSGKVAAREHKQILGTLEQIELLAPGLYQMLISEEDDGTPLARFETRRIADILKLDDDRSDERDFETVAAVSDLNDELYETFMAPWLRALAQPFAPTMRPLHPLRLERAMMSDVNPLFWPVAAYAELARANRKPADPGNRFVQIERELAEQVRRALDAWRDSRDGTSEVVFKALYGPLGFGGVFPPNGAAQDEVRFDETELDMRDGGVAAALIRIALAVMFADKSADVRELARAERLWHDHPRLANLDKARVRELIGQQGLLLELDGEAALAALPALLPGATERQEAVAFARDMAMADTDLSAKERAVLGRIEALLGEAA
ncbi:MAG: DUF3141 domain-containing protein [Geminicoccaceae bacterium]